MQKITDFLRCETGAVAVDGVVLIAGATGMAMAAMAAYSDQLSLVSFNVGAGVQQRETRPSYAYVPHDGLAYSAYTQMIVALPTDDLGVLSAWANSVRATRDQMTDPAAIAFFDDFDNAITIAHARRYTSRDTGTEFSQDDFDRVADAVGIGAGYYARGGVNYYAD